MSRRVDRKSPSIQERINEIFEHPGDFDEALRGLNRRQAAKCLTQRLRSGSRRGEAFFYQFLFNHTGIAGVRLELARILRDSSAEVGARAIAMSVLEGPDALLERLPEKDLQQLAERFVLDLLDCIVQDANSAAGSPAGVGSRSRSSGDFRRHRGGDSPSAASQSSGVYVRGETRFVSQTGPDRDVDGARRVRWLALSSRRV